MSHPLPDSGSRELARKDANPGITRNGWAPRTLKQKLSAHHYREPEGATTPEPAVTRPEGHQLPTSGG